MGESRNNAKKYVELNHLYLFIFSFVSSKLNEKLLFYNFSFCFPQNFPSIISYLPLFSTSPLITKLLQVLLLRISTQSAPKKKAATRQKVCTLCFFTGRALIGLTADNNAAILSLAKTCLFLSLSLAVAAPFCRHFLWHERA